MNDKKFLTAIEPGNREVLLALKEKDSNAYKALIKDLREVWVDRSRAWRKGLTISKEERPLKSWRAREYGWKDKPGFVAVIARVEKGGRKRRQFSGGRKPSKAYSYALLDKSKQTIAEEKANRKFPNCEVLGSYWLWEDGQYKYFEIILVDPNNPHIKGDKEIRWICDKNQRGRVYRGLTPSAKKSRGLRNKGKGAEKAR